MSHTHFLYHIIFATKDRMPLIAPEWEDELYSYLAGIIKNHGGIAIEINGMPDHAHILARLEARDDDPPGAEARVEPARRGQRDGGTAERQQEAEEQPED